MATDNRPVIGFRSLSKEAHRAVEKAASDEGMTLSRFVRYCVAREMERKVLQTRIEAKTLPKPDVRRALRKAAQVTLEDVAVVLGVTRSAVSRWECGNREPRGQNRESYGRVLEEFASHR